jgi:hypothetical protein
MQNFCDFEVIEAEKDGHKVAVFVIDPPDSSSFESLHQSIEAYEARISCRGRHHRRNPLDVHVLNELLANGHVQIVARICAVGAQKALALASGTSRC